MDYVGNTHLAIVTIFQKYYLSLYRKAKLYLFLRRVILISNVSLIYEEPRSLPLGYSVVVVCILDISGVVQFMSDVFRSFSIWFFLCMPVDVYICVFKCAYVYAFVRISACRCLRVRVTQISMQIKVVTAETLFYFAVCWEYHKTGIQVHSNMKKVLLLTISCGEFYKIFFLKTRFQENIPVRKICYFFFYYWWKLPLM